jgi:hypothetical protein
MTGDSGVGMEVKIKSQVYVLGATSNTPASTSTHPLYLLTNMYWFSYTIHSVRQRLYSNLNCSIQWSMYINNASFPFTSNLIRFSPRDFCICVKICPKFSFRSVRSVMMLCYLLKWPYFFGLRPSCNYIVVPHFWIRLYFNLQARKAPNLVVPLEKLFSVSGLSDWEWLV